MRNGINYREYIQSEAWAMKRNEALSRAGHKCCLCACTKHLTVHHNTYERLGDEPMTDLAVLCVKCHAKHHRKSDKVNAKELRGAFSKQAKRMIGTLDLGKQSVPLTTSERQRREAVAQKAMRELTHKRNKRF